MPEVHFTIVWPDGEEELCYSPSTVIKNHFTAGETYALDQFLEKARAGLSEASERVAARYGFACSSAMAQLARIETRAQSFKASPQAHVRCTRIEG